MQAYLLPPSYLKILGSLHYCPDNVYLNSSYVCEFKVAFWETCALFLEVLMVVSVSFRPLMTPLPCWTPSTVTPTKTAPWSCSCSVTIWQWVSLRYYPAVSYAHTFCYPSSLYWFGFEFHITQQMRLNIWNAKVSECALIPITCALLQLWMSDAQGEGEGEGEETEQAAEKNWTSEKNKKQKHTFFTSHQPKLCVWLCVHIHAQICMFTLHSQCVKYSMCVQIHWSVCVNCMSTSTEKRME